MTIRAETKVMAWCYECGMSRRWYLTARGVRARDCDCDGRDRPFTAYEFTDATGLIESAHREVMNARWDLLEAAFHLAQLTGQPVEIIGTWIEPDDE